jgi:hypothetical protein
MCEPDAWRFEWILWWKFDLAMIYTSCMITDILLQCPYNYEYLTHMVWPDFQTYHKRATLRPLKFAYHSAPCGDYQHHTYPTI